VTAKPQSTLLSPLQTARQLAAEFALTAVERDERGGTPKAERDALRHSGLLALSIPTQYGGLGATGAKPCIVREFAKVDSSIAHVFGFHHLMLATVRLFSRPEQWQPWFEQTARRTGSGATPSTRWTPAPWSRTSAAGASFPARKASAPAPAIRKC
jgi:alkylation response protein AidB-like acyl-CoA dehydrogenase